MFVGPCSSLLSNMQPLQLECVDFNLIPELVYRSIDGAVVVRGRMAQRLLQIVQRGLTVLKTPEFVLVAVLSVLGSSKQRLQVDKRIVTFLPELKCK
jgi:hypothetical protein